MGTTVTLIVGLVLGCGLGLLLGFAIQKDRLKIARLACDELLKAQSEQFAIELAEASMRLDRARDELFATWKESDEHAGYYLDERRRLDVENSNLAFSLVKAEAKLRRLTECHGCNGKLQHDPYCFVCGLKAQVSETERAVA